ncbi:MAG TPA: T9SS type A sorting domain-containing protein [Chitinophagaceae bacterium]|nr:T9SS type A sorting domain-containing protein [Chitinophagaceae bacterium]
MKKLYLVIFTFFTLAGAKAQLNNAKFKKISPINNGAPQNTVQSGCDSLNLPVPAKWGIAYYTFNSGAGFVTGNNNYSTEQAQFFNASAKNDSYISEALLGFGLAKTPTATKTVAVKIYDGSTGGPGEIIGIQNITMQTIMTDVAAHHYTDVKFSPAIELPLTKKFFISVDFSSLALSAGDSLTLFSSLVDSATDGWTLLNAANGGYWDTYYNVYSSAQSTADWGLYIHPLLSTGQTCNSLPVHLLSFSAASMGKNISLNWKVAQETGLKEYQVERAADGINFSTSGSVPATNFSTEHSYSFTDFNVYSSGTVYYRLKQVDLDGKVTYSNVISLAFKNDGFGIKVVNPFKGAVEIQVNSPSAEKMQGVIYDMLGRKIVTTQQVLSPGQNSISIQAGTLPKGVYILNVIVGKTTYKYKIIN